MAVTLGQLQGPCSCANNPWLPLFYYTQALNQSLSKLPINDLRSHVVNGHYSPLLSLIPYPLSLFCQAGFNLTIITEDDPVMVRLYKETRSPIGGMSLLMIMEQVGTHPWRKWERAQQWLLPPHSSSSPLPLTCWSRRYHSGQLHLWAPRAHRPRGYWHK